MGTIVKAIVILGFIHKEGIKSNRIRAIGGIAIIGGCTLLVPENIVRAGRRSIVIGIEFVTRSRSSTITNHYIVLESSVFTVSCAAAIKVDPIVTIVSDGVIGDPTIMGRTGCTSVHPITGVAIDKAAQKFEFPTPWYIP